MTKQRDYRQAIEFIHRVERDAQELRDGVAAELPHALLEYLRAWAAHARLDLALRAEHFGLDPSDEVRAEMGR
jgi:hypothetical protein